METAIQQGYAALLLVALSLAPHNVYYATLGMLTAARDRAVGAIADPYGEPLLMDGRGIVLSHHAHHIKTICLLCFFHSSHSRSAAFSLSNREHHHHKSKTYCGLKHEMPLTLRRSHSERLLFSTRQIYHRRYKSLSMTHL